MEIVLVNDALHLLGIEESMAGDTSTGDTWDHNSIDTP